MLVFTVDPHVDESDNHVVITPSITLRTYEVKHPKKEGATITRYGIPLGYFNPRPSEAVGSALRTKYFLVVGNELPKNTDDEVVVDHLALNDQGTKHAVYKAEKETDDGMCLVYFKFDQPDGRGRVCDARALGKDGVLFEGRMEAEATVKEYVPGVRSDVSYYGLMVLAKDKDVSFIYRNGTTRSTRKVTVRFDGAQVNVIENAPLNNGKSDRDGGSRHSHWTKNRQGNMGTLGALMTEAGVDELRDSWRDNGKGHPKSKYGRKQRDRKHRRDYDD